jgi:hypothetical protein
MQDNLAVHAIFLEHASSGGLPDLNRVTPLQIPENGIHRELGLEGAQEDLLALRVNHVELVQCLYEILDFLGAIVGRTFHVIADGEVRAKAR